MLPAFSRIWVINISLAILIVFFGMKSFDVWSQGAGPNPGMQAGKSPERPISVKRMMERTMAPESAYGIVAEKKLFAANRSEVVPEKPKKEGPPKVSENQIFLYGVIMIGDRIQALINNPDPGSVAGKAAAKNKWVKVGDVLGNFSVADIQKEKIILADGADRREILLYDKNKPARQVVAAEKSEKSAGPTVVTTGATASASVPAGAPTPAVKSEQPAVSRVAEGKSAPAGQSGEVRIFNTPFGPVQRKVQ